MIGRTVGNYRVKQLLGQGGMGAVYLAEHPSIGREAAIKVLLPELAQNAQVVKRFFNEARAANAARHPGIVEIFDLGTLPDGATYIVMELLKGESLSTRLDELTRLPLWSAVDIAAQAADALGAAHEQGIVHRDLKPDNIFLIPPVRPGGQDMVKILDFGIAKLGAETPGRPKTGAPRTHSGTVIGTPRYMSPEQSRGTRDVDARTDIYALALILYEMLCGNTPFDSEGFGEMAHLHISTPPPPPRELRGDISPQLEATILRALLKDPADRFQSMAEFRRALLAHPITGPFTVGEQPAPVPPQVSAPLRSSSGASAHDPTVFGRRWRLPRVYTAALAAAIVITGLGVWKARTGDRDVADDDRPAAPMARSPEPAAPARAAPVASSLATARISSEPTGARVVSAEDDVVLGSTPFEYSRPRGTTPIRLRIEKEGYLSVELLVTPDRDSEHPVSLTRETRKPTVRQPVPRRPPATKSAAKAEPAEI